MLGKVKLEGMGMTRVKSDWGVVEGEKGSGLGGGGGGGELGS